MQKNKDRGYIEIGMGILFITIIKGIAKFIYHLFHGFITVISEARKQNFKPLKTFLWCLAASLCSYILLILILPLMIDIYNRKYLILELILLVTTFVTCPAYLFIISFNKHINHKKLKKIFEEKLKLPVKIVSYKTEKEITTLIIKHFCSLEQINKKIKEIENILNMSVISINRSSDHQTCIIKATKKILPSIIHWNNDFIPYKSSQLVIGEGLEGRITIDLDKTPHILIAGETGCGKSVEQHCLVYQAYKKGYDIYICDFKGGIEFDMYDSYAKGGIITNIEGFYKTLQKLITENNRRMKLIRETGTRNISNYNKDFKSSMKRILLVVDEIAEITDIKPASTNEKQQIDMIISNLSTLARQSRATGINIIIGVQRPDYKTVPGQIKNNLPVRISGRFADESASRIVLGTDEATHLREEKGLLLCKVGNTSKEFKGYWIEPEKLLKKQKNKHVNIVKKEMIPVKMINFQKN